MTGRYQHEAGMGWMTAVDEHRPGYRGQISADFPTIAEILKANGYATYMSGKWHLTVEGAFEKPNGSYPTQRGFDKYYGCLSGGGSCYTPTPVYSNMKRITQFPDDFLLHNGHCGFSRQFYPQPSGRSPNVHVPGALCPAQTVASPQRTGGIMPATV